jgi:class 3 adenylate cyclase
MTDTANLDRARKALGEHAWREAYESFSALDADGSLRAEDLELLGEAAWWSAHPKESLDAFERAYTTYLSKGNARRAAFVAVRLANEYLERRDSALWNGWVRRAGRLLEDQPEGVEHGYLELELSRGVVLLGRGSLDESMERSRRALDIGTRFGDRDLQAFGLVLQGWGLVMKAQVEQGLSLADEAAVAAIAGELTPFAAGSIYCITIGVCRAVADYRRAGEWTEAATRWCERQSVTGFPGICRVHRAEIMRLRGALSDAESEARAGLEQLMAFAMQSSAGWGFNEIGEIRRRLGDLDAAEEAFDEAHRFGQEPQPGMALVYLARGRVDAARASIAAALADTEAPLWRVRLLPARAEIALAAHDVAEAREAADELQEIAATYDKPMLHAAADQALGAVLTYEEEAEASVTELRRAVRHWTEADAPFEEAQARRWLAVAHRLAGDEPSALLELRAAKATFERLGARLETERCDEMIRAGERTEAGGRVVRTFMFTDIVGSTDLIGTIGDEAWEDVVRWHDETMRALIGSHRGDLVHSTGDGFFATFGDPTAAISCAVAIQKRFAEHRRRHGFAPPVRIGLHSAEATRIADDYAGLGVHAAARVGALAEGGEIVATISTLPTDTNAIAVSNERDVSLKGIEQPLRVASIDWRP